MRHGAVVFCEAKDVRWIAEMPVVLDSWSHKNISLGLGLENESLVYITTF